MSNKRHYTVAGVCALLTVLLVLLVRLVDVAAIGPNGTSIGLSHLNGAVHNLTGEHMFWYHVTELLGALAILLAAFFGLIGLLQLIRRKSLRKVDREILALGGLYIIVICLYVLFEIVEINYRPVITPGDAVPEASFPSSHTMLSIVVFGSAMWLVPKFIRDEKIRKILRVVCVVLLVVTVLGRLLSGVHWFTDILGGVLISASLLLCFRALLRKN